ncbi:hypothetical protein DSO57_1035956 [Entomophthora muscae]|uniref:Uncharacterized protein n=1 Tax=Entomophthora muscae TaxID=34485 RepID=A0ACC2TLU9_9FUNG|nr:hypothetical protein DSO57_1035956 [Entomophthora muscae]
MEHIFEITQQKLVRHCDSPVDRGLLRFVLIRNFCSSFETDTSSYGEEEWLDDCLDDCLETLEDSGPVQSEKGFFHPPLSYSPVLIASPF